MNHEEIQSLVSTEDYEQLIKILESQLAETTQSAELTSLLIKSYNEYAIELLDQNQPMLALEVLKKAENFTDVDAELRSRTFNNIACCYKVQNKFILALKYIEKAIFLHSSGDLHLNKCAILSMSGKHNKALEEAMFAVIYIQEEMLEKFIQCQEMNVKKCETLAISYHNLAVELEFMRKAPESIEFYSKALNYCEHFSEIDKKLQEKLEIDMKMALKAVQKHSRKPQEPGFRLNSKKKRIIIKNSRSKSPILRSQNTPIKRPDVQEPKKVIGRKFVNTGIKKEKMIELRKTQTLKKEDSENEENFTRTERIFIRESDLNEDKKDELRTNEDIKADDQEKSSKILSNQENEEKSSDYSSFKKKSSDEKSLEAGHRVLSSPKDSSESEKQNSDEEKTDEILKEEKLLNEKSSKVSDNQSKDEETGSKRKSLAKVESDENYSEIHSVESSASKSSKNLEIKSANRGNDSIKHSQKSSQVKSVKDDSDYKKKIPEEETVLKNQSECSSLHSLPSDYKKIIEKQPDSYFTSEKSKSSKKNSSSSFGSQSDAVKWVPIEQKAKDSLSQISENTDKIKNFPKTLNKSEKIGNDSKISQEKSLTSSERFKKKNSNSSLRLLVDRKSENEHEENSESQSKSDLRPKIAKIISSKEDESEQNSNSDKLSRIGSKERLKISSNEEIEKSDQSERIKARHSCQIYQKDSEEIRSPPLHNKKLNSDPIHPHKTAEYINNDTEIVKNLNIEAQISKSSDPELPKSENSVSSSNKILSKSPSCSSKNQLIADRNQSMSSKSPKNKNSSVLNKNENSPSKRSSLISKSSLKSDRSSLTSEKNRIITEHLSSPPSKNQLSFDKNSGKSNESSLKSPLIAEKPPSGKNSLISGKISAKSPLKSEKSSLNSEKSSIHPEKQSPIKNSLKLEKGSKKNSSEKIPIKSENSSHLENHSQTSSKSLIKSLKNSEKPSLNSYKNSSNSDKSPLILDKKPSTSSKNPSLSNLSVNSKKESSLNQSNKPQEPQNYPLIKKSSSDIENHEKSKFKGLLIETSFYDSEDDRDMYLPSHISENAEFFYLEESSNIIEIEKIAIYSDMPSIQDSYSKNPDVCHDKEELKVAESFKKVNELPIKLSKSSIDSNINKTDTIMHSPLPDNSDQMLLCKSIIYSILSKISNS